MRSVILVVSVLFLSLFLVGCYYEEETIPYSPSNTPTEVNSQDNHQPVIEETIQQTISTTSITEKTTTTVIEYDEEEVLEDAEPYINEIITENQDLRVLAAKISKGCSDNECRAVEIFDYVILNYEYISDPRGSEYIQSPFQTMEVGGGDCEDFTILINSLMENVGIETKLVLTEDHAYSLVCDLDVELVNQYVADKLIGTTWDEYYDGIQYYIFDEMNCIVGDGANGYFLGDDAEIEAYEKVVVDPITLEIDFLE
ncbi:transglutaminase domain-containing protein [Candidatus Woesearchaeota archaeon]|nr:transglutaminase domain-containing protein [Candidatus Woesearchaeota archaeon]